MAKIVESLRYEKMGPPTEEPKQQPSRAGGRMRKLILRYEKMGREKTVVSIILPHLDLAC
jgi:uncharacterized membrane protein